METMWIALPAAVWVSVCAGYDLLQRRVPNGLMASGWMGAAALRIAWTITGKGNAGTLAGVTLAAWALAMTYWLVGWWGAADAKFVMALALAFPDPWMLLVMTVANLAVGVSTLIWGKRPSLASPRTLPAVAYLGAGWIVWTIVVLTWGIL